MKNNLNRLVHGIISVVTTFIFMAAPVAAIVYSSESLEPSKTTFVRNLSAHRENAPQTERESVHDKPLQPPPALDQVTAGPAKENHKKSP